MTHRADRRRNLVTSFLGWDASVCRPDPLMLVTLFMHSIIINPTGSKIPFYLIFTVPDLI